MDLGSKRILPGKIEIHLDPAAAAAGSARLAPIGPAQAPSARSMEPLSTDKCSLQVSKFAETVIIKASC